MATMNNLVELAIAPPALPDVRDVVAFAEQLTVDSPESAEMVAELYRDWRVQYDRIEAKRVEMKAPILEAGRRWDAFLRQRSIHYAQPMNGRAASSPSMNTNKKKRASKPRRPSASSSARARKRSPSKPPRSSARR